MRIGIPLAGGRLCAHFGHCEQFALVDADEQTKQVVKTTRAVPPPHEPGALPRWLHDQGVDLVITGGMGRRALQLFENFGIRVVVGAPADTPERVANAYLTGKLMAGENICDH